MLFFKYKILPILGILCYLVFFGSLNYFLIEIQMNEMDLSMSYDTEDESVNRSLGMLARIENVKKRLKEGAGAEDDQESYVQETKMYALMSHDFFKTPKAVFSSFNPILPLVRLGINTIRIIFKKEMLSPRKRVEEGKTLALAYFQQRNKRYSSAIRIYEDIVKLKGSSKKTLNYVRLHLGYCKAMIGYRDQAIILFEKIIEDNPQGSELTRVAWKLLDFLLEMKNREAQIAKAKKRTLETGMAYYQIVNYRKAILHLATSIKNEKNKKRPSPQKMTKALFYLARSHEELGMVDRAKEAYAEIIEYYPQSQEALDGNRRLFIMGEFYDQDQKLANLAKQRMLTFKDEAFFSELDGFKNLLKETKGIKEKGDTQKEKDLVQAPLVQDPGLAALLTELDDMGVSDFKENMEIVKKEIPRYKPVKLKRPKIKSMKKLPSLLPVRKKSYIRRLINNNTRSLNYAYRGFLKRGIKFSGKVWVHFIIKNNGKLRNIYIKESTLGNPAFEKKILKAFSRIKFPPIKGNWAEMPVNFPMDFSSKE